MDKLEKNDLLSWLDFDELKSIQTSFYHIAGMPICAYSIDGEPLTSKVGGTTFCDILVQQNKKTNSMCERCRLYSAQECFKVQRAVYSYCYLGLIEICCPIIVDGKMVAYITGGMVFDRPPVESEIKHFAELHDLDPDMLWEAALKVPVKPQHVVERAAEGLFNYSYILSKSADSRIRSFRATSEIEKAAQMKNDFLANMSHEIRTPMNAVIGMAELATQEEISPTAREYLENIQSSGKTLLHIINDILDYSKISSGKMSIFEEKYSPISLIRDVTSIISNRLRDKADRIFLKIDVDPDIPMSLVGDFARIQQVIINLANNAVKFTNTGYIKISYECTYKEYRNCKLKVTVKDTGIGIKKEDHDKLFSSFTQVDSRRNRNVEGTGLGLAIVKQLISLMHGTVSLESEYGIGSTFSFEIPQEISDPSPLCKVNDPRQYIFLTVIEDHNMFSSFHDAVDKLGMYTQAFDYSEISKASLLSWIDDHKALDKYVFFDDLSYEMGFFEKVGFDFEKHPEIKLIYLTEGKQEDKKVENSEEKPAENPTELPKGTIVVKSPITTISLATILEGVNESQARAGKSKSEKQLSFTAPEAKIMVVDDIPMNLKLAERLLAKLQIKVDLASSGQECLEKLVKEDYDLIFMDHMMPGLDGIDTVRLIRRFHTRYNEVPIIALTANVMEDAKKMFLDEGMSDIIPKPIEVKVLHEKLLTWLPKDKIVPAN